MESSYPYASKKSTGLFPLLDHCVFGNLAHAMEMAAQAERLQIMQANLAKAYGPDYLAGMLLERYSEIVHVREFKQHIDESLKAYFSGYKLIAIIALVTVLEGVVRRIAMSHGRNIGSGTKKLNKEFEAFVDRELKSPHCFGERVVMLEVLRDFVRDRLLEDTRNSE